MYNINILISIAFFLYTNWEYVKNISFCIADKVRVKSIVVTKSKSDILTSTIEIAIAIEAGFSRFSLVEKE